MGLKGKLTKSDDLQAIKLNPMNVQFVQDTPLRVGTICWGSGEDPYPSIFAASDTEPSTANRRSNKACIPCNLGGKDIHENSNLTNTSSTSLIFFVKGIAFKSIILYNTGTNYLYDILYLTCQKNIANKFFFSDVLWFIDISGMEALERFKRYS